MLWLLRSKKLPRRAINDAAMNEHLDLPPLSLCAPIIPHNNNTTTTQQDLLLFNTVIVKISILFIEIYDCDISSSCLFIHCLRKSCDGKRPQEIKVCSKHLTFSHPYTPITFFHCSAGIRRGTMTWRLIQMAGWTKNNPRKFENRQKR